MRIVLLLLLFAKPVMSLAQKTNQGKLFIIGGGDRPASLNKKMIAAAGLQQHDYIAVLPMASGQKDSSFYYFKLSVDTLCSNPVVYMDFTTADVNNRQRVDSLAAAKLIYITGGQQTRFMDIVAGTPVYDAIHRAYKSGATIAGTSAGAAVMSEQMITGAMLRYEKNEKLPKRIYDNNVAFGKGLGLLQTAIIDQHFIARSRYGRLLAALYAFPTFECIGIDESTAILVEGKKVTVLGEGQVILFADPQGLAVTQEGLIKYTSLRTALFTEGDNFILR